MNYKAKIIFWGTPEFAVPTLKKLNDGEFKPILVVTQPDRPAGRGKKITGPAVKKAAESLGLKTIQPQNPNSPDFIKKLKNLKPDLFIVAAYGKILKKELLEIPRLGALNIHPSILPQYRGASPIQAALISGDNETGATIMLLDEKMDHGPILTQKKIKIEKNDTFFSLSEKLAAASAALLFETLPLRLTEKIAVQSQDENRATFTSPLTKEDGEILWSESAELIGRKIRAYYPWPGSFTHFQTAEREKKLLKIISASPLPDAPETENLEAGQIFVKNSDILVRCGEGVLKLHMVQVEGKNKIGAKEFINGYPFLTGKNLF